MRMIWNGRRGTKLLSVTVLGLCLLACGKSSDTRPRYVSNVSGAGTTQPVSNLSTAQATEICKSYDAYVNTYVDLDAIAYLACIPAALFTSATREACQASLQNCMAVFPKPIQVSAKAQNVQVCANTLAQCQATVGQLDGCINVNVDRALAVINTWSCDMVGNPSYRAMVQPTGGLVNVCTDLNSACGNFAQVNNTPQ
jgi:hypothetical protein